MSRETGLDFICCKGKVECVTGVKTAIYSSLELRLTFGVSMV